MRIACENCEDGRIIKSRWGGNDPDTWDAGPCPECDGTGYKTAHCECCDRSATRIFNQFVPLTNSYRTEYWCEACFAETEG